MNRDSRATVGTPRPVRGTIVALLAAIAPLAGAAAPPDRESLVRALSEPRREVRVEAADGLASTSADVEDLLSHPSRWVRSAAAESIRRDPSEGAIPALARALATERDPLAREALAAALAATGNEARAAVRAACASLREDSRSAVFDAYVRAVVEREVRLVLKEITDSTGSVKGFYAKPFAGIHDIRDAAVPVLVDFVRSGRTSFLGRQVAVRGLAEMGDPRAIPALRAVFDGFSSWMAEREIEEELVPDLGAEIPNEVELRKYVSHALFRLGDRGPFDVRLRKFFTDLAGMGSIRRWDFGAVNPSDVDVIRGFYAIGYEHHQVREWDDALAYYAQAKAIRDQIRYPGALPWDYLASYNMACIEAQRGNLERAIAYLAESIEDGFADDDWISRDPDLDPLRAEPLFRKIILREGDRPDGDRPK